MTKEEKKCNGAHCKCMNLGEQCPNNHYGDHLCPYSFTPSAQEEKHVDDCLKYGCSLERGCTVISQPPQQKEPETWEEQYWYLVRQMTGRYGQIGAGELLQFFKQREVAARTEAKTSGWNEAIEFLLQIWPDGEYKELNKLKDRIAKAMKQHILESLKKS